MYHEQTETQKFLAKISRQVKRAQKRAVKREKAAAKGPKTAAVSANKAPRSVGKDGFYACIQWRTLRYLALKNCEGRCQSCGATAADGVRIHVDHIKPRSRFPNLALSLENLQVLCDDCNIGKGAWDETDWRDSKRSYVES
jgi:5-methylcytosine-specific restriction endonuclease McrA